jgi:hypothetical protein
MFKSSFEIEIVMLIEINFYKYTKSELYKQVSINKIKN